MAALFLVVLFGCVWSAVGQADLMKLSEGYKAGEELALKQIHAHPGVQHHFVFFKSIQKSELDAGFDVKYLSHHFYVKPTRCAKGTATIASKCPFRNDKPLIDCMTCYKTFKNIIEEKPNPYIHCVHRPAITKDMIQTRKQHCENMSYSSGSISLLAIKSNSGK